MSKDTALTENTAEKIVKHFEMMGFEYRHCNVEAIESLLEQERQKVREEERERIFYETADLRIFYGKKENMPAYKLVHDTIRKIWLVLGAKQNKKGEWELSQPKKEQDEHI